MDAPPQTFQGLISALQDFWEQQGCCLLQPFDMEMGAGTFHPATFLRALGDEPWRMAYAQGCRRPTDGRYGENPNRLQHYYQYQVLLKPAPANIQSLYLDSLRAIGLDLRRHDVRFVEDNWESPTLAAWGLGWEVWLNGMEVTQFTYFQQVGGIACRPVSGEITYGLERLAMYLQGKGSVYDLLWSDGTATGGRAVRYKELFQRNERELSRYNFEEVNPQALGTAFGLAHSSAEALIEVNLPMAAYEQVLRASHCFNLLDARGALSVDERQRYMLNVRTLAQKVALSWCGEDAEPQKKSKQLPPPRSTPKYGDSTDLAVGEHCCLVELGCEELPARELSELLSEFSTAMSSSLREIAVGYKKIETFASPRRLALLLHGLPTLQPRQDIWGPPAEQITEEGGEFSAVARSFAKKYGCSTADLLVRDGPKGRRLTLPMPGSDTPLAESLCGRVEQALHLMSRNQPLRYMRWDNGKGREFRFVRPVRWVVLMLDNALVPGQLFGLSVGRKTYGHRIHAPEPLHLAKATDYAITLKQDGHVIADLESRIGEVRHKIAEACANIPGAVGATAHLAEDGATQQLLEEVAALCEWPVALLCHFEPRFLAMPPELLRIVLQKQQRYFPLWDDNAQFLPYFIVISNLNSEAPEEVRAGNERVVRARLEDALFFYKNDQKLTLEEHRELLRGRVFQADLGSLYDKSLRLEELVKKLIQAADWAPNFANPAAARLAARLCKADLASELVREFPELQGIIGGHYLRQQEDRVNHQEQQENYANAAQAIGEHYRNPFTGQLVGSCSTSQLLAISDRLDHLVCHFIKGHAPSGSGDPFALRPAALGILSNLLADVDAETEQPWWVAIELRSLLIDGCDALGAQGTQASEAIVDALMEFLVERLRSFCHQEYQVNTECFNAVLGNLAEPRRMFPIAFVCHLRHMQHFLDESPAQAKELVATWKRAANLLRKGGQPTLVASAPATSQNTLPLLNAVAQFRNSHTTVSSASTEGVGAWRCSTSMEQRLRALGTLARPLAKFMDQTMVLCDNPQERTANLYALQELETLFSEVADFSQLSL